MDETFFTKSAIEQACKDIFNQKISVGDIIVAGVPAGVASYATVFTAAHGQMWAYIISQGPQVLDDVQKIISRMNIIADAYVPPHGEADYFSRIGRAKFTAMFPGKPIINDDDIRYYKKLAPYNPALVKISKINGEIRAYDMQSKAWRKVKDYSYSKIKTS